MYVLTLKGILVSNENKVYFISVSMEGLGYNIFVASGKHIPF